MTGIPDIDLIFINEGFYADEVRPGQLDMLLADGWRHFGTHFFRYSLNVYRDEIRRVLPLRVRLADFRFSKSQRRCLRKNSDLRIESGPIYLTRDCDVLFHRHKGRFETGIPTSILEFLSHDPAYIPCEAREIAVYDDERLIAVSYFDVGKRTVSGIYAMFDPEYASRGLGTFTMLKEIEFALATGCEFYYQGYAYEGHSFYDYKKRLSGTEVFDWHKRWAPLAEAPA